MITSSSATGVTVILSSSMEGLKAESLHLLVHPMTAEVLREMKKETLGNDV